jgi:hypothetical protein
MPIELLVPIGIFLVGMLISDRASAAALKIVEANNKSK